jgi:hypothetical protein
VTDIPIGGPDIALGPEHLEAHRLIRDHIVTLERRLASFFIVIDQGFDDGYAVAGEEVRIHAVDGEGRELDWDSNVTQVFWGDNDHDRLQTHTYTTVVDDIFVAVSGVGQAMALSPLFSVRAGYRFVLDGVNSVLGAMVNEPVTCRALDTRTGAVLPVGHFASIDWGDGTPATPANLVHTYTAPQVSCFVTVTDQVGVAIRSDGFGVRNPTPIFNSIAPNTGPAAGGTSVTIRGFGFDPPPVNRVTFDGIDATDLVIVDHNTLTCTTPPHAPGAVTVGVIATSGSSSLSAAYTYTP